MRRVASHVDADGRAGSVTHTARDSSDPQVVACRCVVSNAAPAVLSTMLPAPDAGLLTKAYAEQQPSISLFALTLGLAKPPREFGVSHYSTQLLPDWMTTLADYAQGTSLMGGEPAGRMPPLAIVDYAAIPSAIPAPPFVLSVVGTDRVSNWDQISPDDYRDKRGRWQAALITYLDGHYPGLAKAVIATSFNTALSVQQYLNAPNGSVYGFAPGPARSPRTPVTGVYLASAYAGLGGYTGAIEAGGACADMILADS